MKVAVSSYSFSRMYESGELNQSEAILKAKEIGFDGIEFSEITPHDGSSQEEYAAKLKKIADDVGIEISNFVFGADLINGTKGRTQQQEIEYVKRMIDIGDILGVKTVRHDATCGGVACRSFDIILPTLANTIREITEYAQTKGIKTMVENHGFFAQDSIRVEKLFSTVNHPNFGLLCDIGNFLCADDNPVTAVSRVAPYAIYAHAKDFHVKSGSEPNPGEGFFTTRGGNYIRGAIIGHGNVPVKQCLRILKKAGYDGYVSIEFEGMEENVNALKIGLTNLRRYLDELNRE